eukprot:jgi/Psemu1/43126/gm1.43126_g
MIFSPHADDGPSPHSKRKFSFLLHSIDRASYNFADAGDPASQVRSELLDHDGFAKTMPYPLPEGSSNEGFTTWLSAMHLFATKNQAFSLYTQHSLFDAANWSEPGPGDTFRLSNATLCLNPLHPTPNYRMVCLPFIDDFQLHCLQTVSQSLPNTSLDPQEHTLQTPAPPPMTSNNRN